VSAQLIFDSSEKIPCNLNKVAGQKSSQMDLLQQGMRDLEARMGEALETSVLGGAR
jgi:hypothetical protein